MYIYPETVVVNIHDIDCRKEEYRIRRYNSILKGINRIFSSVVNAETEEKLGEACLSVALEVTGSKIGFVGEVGDDGLLHDIAISDMGWDQCLMYDKTGHRRPPGDFVLHGLYGCAIDTGKGFFINNPRSHPNSIGLPQGHPEIISFLGVPLIQEGETLGVIAVANREGGYSLEQQEDLEAIAPAMVQALQRKKVEEALKESEHLLAEAQRIAHLGNWEFDIETDKISWSNETYRIFGLTPQEFGATYDSFLSYIHPADRDFVNNAVKEALSGKPYNIDYRIVLASGEERVVHAHGEVTFNEENIPVQIRGIIQDITERKKAEEALTKIEKARIKEIHHRIKNNLQVISSLLDLQAEKFSHLEACNTSEVIDAFKGSQNRVFSMALIHEELYQGKGTDSLDFKAYIQKLTQELFSSYNLRNKDISLKMDLQEAHLDMDTAIPLGIIVNELVSNSLKHAFLDGNKWEIRIILKKTEDLNINRGNHEANCICREEGNYQHVLIVADNGKGIPEEIDLENVNSLGLQLVNLLVEQIDGCIELKREQGTEFTIWFSNIEK